MPASNKGWNTFDLSPELNLIEARRAFDTAGRIRLSPFLADTFADNLRNELDTRRDWKRVFNAGAKVYEMDAMAERDLTIEQAQQLDAALDNAARHGFQFRYETIRVDDRAEVRASKDGLLERFAEAMSVGPLGEAIRSIINRPFGFADAQATRYRAGDFLSVHDDAVDGKGRVAAYVLSLTHGWTVDRGGLLVFHHDTTSVEGWVPTFNTLSLFTVPYPHSVTQVSSFADQPRLSVTGWLRNPDGPRER